MSVPGRCSPGCARGTRVRTCCGSSSRSTPRYPAACPCTWCWSVADSGRGSMTMTDAGLVSEPPEAVGGLGGRCPRPEPVMTLPRSVADVLDRHVTFEIESIDRIYLNVYQPRLQYPKGAAAF